MSKPTLVKNDERWRLMVPEACHPSRRGELSHYGRAIHCRVPETHEEDRKAHGDVFAVRSTRQRVHGK